MCIRARFGIRCEIAKRYKTAHIEEKLRNWIQEREKGRVVVPEGIVERESSFMDFFYRCGAVLATRRAAPVPLGFGYSMLAHLYGY